MNPCINGIGTAMGSRIIYPKDIAEKFGKPVRRVERLGIENLHRYSENETLEEKAVAAFASALNEAEIIPEDLVGIYACVAVPTPGYLMPGLARIVGKNFGLEGIPMISGGIGCSGGIEVLQMACDRFAKRPGNYLVIAGDNTSAVLDENDWETAPLFSEGAAAVVIGHQGRRSLYSVEDVRVSALEDDIYSMHVTSDTPRSESASFGNPRFRMEGEEVFKFATYRAIPEVFRLLGLDKLPENAYLIPHQASGLILEHIAGRNNIPANQIYTEGVKEGNLTAASVFFGLNDVVGRNLAQERDIILATFGAELAVGAAYLKNVERER